MSAQDPATPFRVTFRDASGGAAAVGFPLELLVDHMIAATATVGEDGVATFDLPPDRAGSHYMVRMKHPADENGRG
jgi:hypothetical protein